MKYVSIGDVVGKPETHDRQGLKTSDATTVAFANDADVKILGNRDLNKLRILPEYLYWVAKGQPVITDKVDLVPLTFPYLTVTDIEDVKRLPGTWLHDLKTQRPNESILGPTSSCPTKTSRHSGTRTRDPGRRHKRELRRA